MSASRHWNGSVECTPEALDKFMRALKSELDKEAQAAGGQVKKSSDHVKEGRLEGFAFDYTTTAKIRGQVKATTERTAGAGGEKGRYKFDVSIDEKFP